MTFEVVTTQSWNVLGTFEDESVAREAIRVATEQGSQPDDLVVYVSDACGQPISEIGGKELAEWARAGHGLPGASANPVLACVGA